MKKDMAKSIARRAVGAIVSDIGDRCGLDNFWEDIDADTRKEITREWRKLIFQAIREEEGL